MTTIVANRQCMAGDSLATHAGRKWRMRKLFRVRGSIIGLAGDAHAGLGFIQWAKAGGQGTTPSGDYEALVLQANGKLVLYIGPKPGPVYEDYYAIGSGADAALGALHMGATPEKAVRIAAKVDNGTGGRVQVYRRQQKART